MNKEQEQPQQQKGKQSKAKEETRKKAIDKVLAKEYDIGEKAKKTGRRKHHSSAFRRFYSG